MNLVLKLTPRCLTLVDMVVTLTPPSLHELGTHIVPAMPCPLPHPALPIQLHLIQFYLYSAIYSGL